MSEDDMSEKERINPKISSFGGDGGVRYQINKADLATFEIFFGGPKDHVFIFGFMLPEPTDL